MKSSYIGINRKNIAERVGVGETHVSNSPRRQAERYSYVRHMALPLQTNSTYAQRMVTGESCPVRRKNTVPPVIEHTAQLHLENIRRNLERRLAVAQARGDAGLVSLLQLEFKQLAFCF